MIVARSYLSVVTENGGCPTKVRTDCGTANGLLAAAQCYFMADIESHIYGSSPHNQRIKACWSFYRRSRATWWINFFKDLNTVPKDHWNTHLIRKSRHETDSGRPDELFHLPELHLAQDFKHLSLRSNAALF